MYIVQHDTLQLRYNSCNVVTYFSVIFFHHGRDIFYNFDRLNNVIDAGLWDILNAVLLFYTIIN